MTELGQRVANAVISEFDKLNVKSGKPTTRSNGVQEWTVLAGLVAIQNDAISVVSLATGVKAMPDEVRSYSAGRIVHDMHAEMLCLRIFNWYLMEEIKGNCERKLLVDTEDSEGTGQVGISETAVGDHNIETTDANYTKSASTQDTDPLVTETISPASAQNSDSFCLRKYRLDPAIKLALYISEPPCGDASMSHISHGHESWESEKHDDVNSDEPSLKKQKIVRGRANFGELGVVRTKPGRADSKVSLSKSCSDKLCLRQYTGILNCINSLRVAPVYLDFLVLHKEKHHPDDFSRCFSRRLADPPTHQLQALTFSESNYKFAKHPDKSPSFSSITYCGLTKTVQVLNNGVKNGAYIKNKPPKVSGMSITCRRNLWGQAQGQVPDFKTYSQLKTANVQRQHIKLKARAQLGSWPQCGNDDFSI